MMNDVNQYTTVFIWSTLEDKLVKFQKRAARVILDCDVYTPSSELFIELNWQTFPERVTYQKAILMHRIINNICPDYLKNYVSYTSDISCRHTRSTNCNQLYTPKPNCELFPQVIHVLWNWYLEFSPPTCQKCNFVNTFKSLYPKWKRLNDHWIISSYYCQSDSVFCTDLVNNSVFFIDLINAYFMSFIWLAWFGIDVLVSVYYSLLWHATTLVSCIYTWSLLPT